MDKPTAGVGAAQKIEKQARQLAYDTRYKVKQMMKSTSGSRLDPASVTKAYLAQLARSSAAPAVKARAKQMLTGNVKEEVMSSVDPKDMATDAIATALYKVFVEKKEDNVEEQVEELKEFYSKVNKKGERIYHVRITDKKTGNSYTRDATREKIAELRANPNIASVEMSEVNKDAKREKTKGANTASVKAGKGLDPVGQEDKDIDNDGDHDKTDKYLLNRRQARGAAIAKRKGVSEEFIGEVKTEKKSDSNKKIDVMKGENKVVIAPEVPGSGKKSPSFMQVAHYDMQGNPLSESEMKLAKMLQEKAVSKAQQRFMGMVYAAKKGEKPASAEVAAAAKGMTKKEAKKFAKTKHKGLPEVKEETVAQADKKAKKEQDEMDPRSIPTAVNLAKNKLRAMGAKNPIVMTSCEEVEVVDENAANLIRLGLGAGTALAGLGLVKKAQEIKGQIEKRGKKQESQINQLMGRESVNYSGDTISEEDYDRMKDRKQEVGGVSANADQKPVRKPAPGTQRSRRRRSSAPSAIDLVRASVEKKYGKGSLM